MPDFDPVSLSFLKRMTKKPARTALPKKMDYIFFTNIEDRHIWVCLS
jgi:hypothetical protein